mmetsp:Transcript_117745/g.205018  ORF Transcript_117745/g.205018 Transcript_117745/m.205018 type:complete len:89 (-) Transcript_117745:208-474(-)
MNKIIPQGFLCCAEGLHGPWMLCVALASPSLTLTTPIMKCVPILGTCQTILHAKQDFQSFKDQSISLIPQGRARTSILGNQSGHKCPT